MTKYVTRKISKRRGKVIIPPTPEEILDDNFNYHDYVKRILNIKIDNHLLEEFFESSNEDFTPADPEINKAFEDYENAIIEVQKQYELCHTLLDYNQAMKNIAQSYFDRLKKLTTFKLQKEQEFQALTAKRSELVTILNRVVNIKKNIEDGAESRLLAFVNREIPLGKLYLYDLTQIQNSEVYLKHKKALDTYRRKVFSRLLDQEGAEYKPIEQLHLQRKK